LLSAAFDSHFATGLPREVTFCHGAAQLVLMLRRRARCRYERLLMIARSPLIARRFGSMRRRRYEAMRRYGRWLPPAFAAACCRCAKMPPLLRYALQRHTRLSRFAVVDVFSSARRQ